MLRQTIVLKEPSDCKEALPQEDVWRSATITSGAQCVMTSGVLLMLELLANSWVYQAQVITLDSDGITKQAVKVDEDSCMLASWIFC